MISQVGTSQESVNIAQPDLILPVVKPIHTQANKLVREIVSDFENDLRLQANNLAKDDEIVLSSHVREALAIIRRKNNGKWTEELLILIGSVLLGAFLTGFVNELSLLRPFWILLYVILELMGSFLIFISYIRKYSR